MRATAVIICLLFLPLVSAQGDHHVADDMPLDSSELRGDILSVDLAESTDGLTFSVDGVDIDPDSMGVHILFTHTSGNTSTEVALVADPDAFSVYRDAVLVDQQTYGGGQGPGSVDRELSKDFILGTWQPGDTLDEIRVVTTLDGRSVPYQEPNALDRAPDTGFGVPYTLELGTGTVAGAVSGSSVAGLAGDWLELEGPDLGGGASVAVDSQGHPHVAYYVYDDARDTPTGIYYAAPDGAWQAERVADYHQADGRDTRMRTRLVMDDATPHMLFTADPDDGDDQIRYATRSADGWVVEDPSGDATAASDTTSVPDLAVRDGRVVAAMRLTDGSVAVTERDDAGWSVIHKIDDARKPRVAIGDDGTVHVAFFREDPSDDRGGWGDLIYTRSTDWAEAQIGSGLNDRSVFWETSETDGSYDMALAPDGSVAFAWDSYEEDQEDSFAIVRDGTIVREDAPLQPGHGNIQLTIRIAYDGQGNLHMGSGYGGTDIYAVRDADGAWSAVSIDRHDGWDMAVSADGVPYFAYSQPHGGTTVALSWLEGGLAPESAWTPAPADEQFAFEEFIPVGPAPFLALAVAMLVRRK